MAIYPFRCDLCNRDWEVTQSALVPVNKACPECGAEGKRLWPRDSKVKVVMGFTSGYDVFAGAHFDSDRQRNNYIQSKGLRKLYKKPHGDIIKRT